MPRGFSENKVWLGELSPRAHKPPFELWNRAISEFLREVVVAETSYQMLEGLSFYDRERG